MDTFFKSLSVEQILFKTILYIESLHVMLYYQVDRPLLRSTETSFKIEKLLFFYRNDYIYFYTVVFEEFYIKSKPKNHPKKHSSSILHDHRLNSLISKTLSIDRKNICTGQ